MTIDYYLERQRQLDDTIMDNIPEMDKPIDKNELMAKKILALQTEVSEFANATRCFKYWSNKAPESEDRQIDEWVDIFHFLLSIANLKGYTGEAIEKAYDKKNQENYNRQKTGY